MHPLKDAKANEEICFKEASDSHQPMAGFGGMDICGRFSAIFTRADNRLGFQFAFLYTSEIGSTLKEKICSSGTNYCLLE